MLAGLIQITENYYYASFERQRDIFFHRKIGQYNNL